MRRWRLAALGAAGALAIAGLALLRPVAAVIWRAGRAQVRG